VLARGLCTITTGQSAWWATCWLTEPSSRLEKPPPRADNEQVGRGSRLEQHLGRVALSRLALDEDVGSVAADPGKRLVDDLARFLLERGREVRCDVAPAPDGGGHLPGADDAQACAPEP
jgi:hypothetical protein